MTFGIILCAGKQTRFNHVIHKSLMKLDEETILDKNIVTMKKYCNIVYVTIQKGCYIAFNEVCKKYDFVKIIEIESGYGCGDAVLKTLKHIRLNNTDRVFLIWGDSVNTDSKVYEACLNNMYNIEYEIVVPLVWVKNPYVCFKLNHSNEISEVLFSKYDENNKEGCHDFSLFYFNAKKIKKALKKTKKRNKELIFLDIFNFNNLYSRGMLTYYDDDNSFNTLEEFNKLKTKFLYNKKRKI